MAKKITRFVSSRVYKTLSGEYTTLFADHRYTVLFEKRGRTNMIKFNGKRVYVKGTCNVVLRDPSSGDVWYQSDKVQTGNITTSVNLNEIRAGLNNPIAAMIPSDAGITVDFTMADFDLRMKAAQLGATFAYSAPVWQCVDITATGTTLSIDVTEGVPVAALGFSTPKALVQTVGTTSLVTANGTAYDVNPTTGLISGFSAVSGTKYRVWYHIQKVSAQIAAISSFIDPKVAYFESQHAVYANDTDSSTQGTRIGWLYVIIPRMKLQADATITGDQTTADTTKVSGQAVTFDSDVVGETCSDCEGGDLGYYVYVPDDDSSSIDGLVVLGGVTNVVKSTSKQLPVLFAMKDGSLVAPKDYATGFSYTLSSAPSGTTISSAGVIAAGSTTGDCDCTTTYTSGNNTYTVVSAVRVVNS